MYLKAHLGWLSGFPLAQGEGWIDWMVCTPDSGLSGKPVRLDRGHLQKAEFAVNRLVHRFGKALPLIVQEADQWPTCVRRILHHLKAAVHEGHALPACLPEAVAALPAGLRRKRAELLNAHPTLQPLADAFAWLLILTPAAAGEAIDWLRMHPAELIGLLRALGPTKGITTGVALWRIAQADDDAALGKLLRLLGNPASHMVPIEGVSTYLEQWACLLSRYCKNGEIDAPPEPPTMTTARAVLPFLERTLQSPPQAQRQSLKLFDLLVDETVLQPWHALWPLAERAVSRAQRILCSPAHTHSEAQRETARDHAAHLRELAGSPLPRVALELLLDSIPLLLAPAYGALRQQLLRTLPLLPPVEAGQSVRAGFFVGWVDESHWASAPHVADFVRRFHEYLAGRDIKTLLQPWEWTVAKWNKGNSSFEAIPGPFGEGPSTRPWGPVFFGALRVLCERGTCSFGNKDADCLFDLAAIAGNVERTVADFDGLTAAGLRDKYLPKELLGCARQLSQVGADYRHCVEHLWRLSETERDEEVFPFLSAVVEALRDTGQGEIAGRLACHQEYSPLLAAGRAVLFLRRLDSTLALPAIGATVGTLPAWAARYPEQLHPTLIALEGLVPGAEAIAERILCKEFPPAARLEQEVAALQERLRSRPDDGGLAQRLANLMARRTNPPKVSSVRLGYLKTKLALAGDRLVLERWQQQIDAQVRSALTRLLQVDVVPDWLLQGRYLSLLAAVVQLAEPYRELALRLFRGRLGMPPWDCREEPANQLFLTRLRARGIDPGPWLSPLPEHWVEGRNGRRVRLGIEEGPLEVLRMGEPFRTCLSPGACNFFSAVTNAVDVNKRVLFARDARGQVVGRCLIALTDSGHLLTFNPYSHDSELGFDQLVSQHVEQLAARMGTCIARRGNVPALVAPDWYDDGPSDLCHRFAFLDHGSAFRQALPTLALHELLPALQAACAPVSLNDVTLPLVIELDELDQRPELVLPLLSCLEAAANLPQATWWRAAGLAHKAGEEGFAARVINRRILPDLVKAIREHGLCRGGTSPALAVLAEIDPSTTLRVLRQTRPRGVHEDEEETDDARRTFLASAHERLGRTELAERLRSRSSAGQAS